MRITKIEFENLNSLKGHWLIDLTDGAFKKNHNQFVICGETGAGKTTILDAITLALYGKTARLSEINGNNNEIMTRNTNFCMASVTYECGGKEYVSRFSQSRKPRSGKLDTSDFSILNTATQELFSTHKSSEMEKKTAQNIQLDYGQFCKSIMLAQGEFNVFLEGDKNSSGNERKRAEILAKINGTEKYKKIGEKIYKKAVDAENEYNLAGAELKNIEILDDEKIKNLDDEKIALDKKIKKSEDEINSLTKQLNWLKEIEEDEKKLFQANLERKKFEERKISFTASGKILEKAGDAKKCDVEYSKVIETKRSIKNLNEKLDMAEKSLSDAEKFFLSAKKESENAKKNYDEENSKSEENEDLWKKVRELDTKIVPTKKMFSDQNERKCLAEKEYNNATTKKLNLEKQKENLEKEISTLQKYLDGNKKDENISEKIVFLDGMTKSIKANSDEKYGIEKKLASEKKSLKQNKKDLDELNKQIEEIEGQLEKLVSREYLNISKLIRKKLSNGSPCPVCGSKEHPYCDEVPNEKKDLSTDEIGLAENVSELHKKYEEKKSFGETLKDEAVKLGTSISSFEERLKSLSEEKKGWLTEINSSINGWNFFVGPDDGQEKILQIIGSMKEKSKTFSEKKNLLDKAGMDFKKTEIEIKSINTENLLETFELENKKLDDVKTNLDSLLHERKNLFGEKSVDEEENEFKINLKNLLKISEVSEKKRDDTEKNKIALESDVENFKKQIKEELPKLKSCEDELNLVLKKNNFSSVDEYLSCKTSEEKIKELEEQKRQIEKEDAATTTKIKITTDNLEKAKSKNLTGKNVGEVEKEILEKQNERDEANKRLGEIVSVLKNHDGNKLKYEEKHKKFEEAEKTYLLWRDMKNFIGVKDGSDFEVFVQSMALQNLLVRANKYIHAITGRFTLVQKNQSVDFMVHDDNYPDPKDDRPIINMSGGEKFIISLSLALGIAELASRNVQVNSLFLDEGFGTLSGAPLIEAVNALKSLQSTGKTLGIITHVSDVIKEFDQKIVAEKHGSTSTLKGDGVKKIG